MIRKMMTVTLVAIALTSCTGPQAFTRGTYADPNTIEMLSDSFNENDMQLISKKLVDSLQGSPAFAQIQGRPLIVIGKLKNATTEIIDMNSLGDKLLVQLTRTGKFSFQDKGARPEIAEEYEYQGSGYTKPDEAKGPGQQASADYLMTGELSSNVQEVGRDKMVYYKMTLKLSNLTTGIIEWTDDKEIRKKFAKQPVSW